MTPPKARNQMPFIVAICWCCEKP